MFKYFYACDWLMNFDTFDANTFLEYVEEYNYKLNILPVGNKIMRLIVSMSSAEHFEQFISVVYPVLDTQEWRPVSYDDFDHAKPIPHSVTNRDDMLQLFHAIQRVNFSQSQFYVRIYKSQKPFVLYQSAWVINKVDVRRHIISRMYKIVEDYEDTYMVTSFRDKHISSLSKNMLYIYIVTSDKVAFDKLRLEFPQSNEKFIWEEIVPDQVPSITSGNPSYMSGSEQSMLSAALYGRAAKNED